MKNWPIFFIILITVAFFWQFFAKGLLPIPSDTIVGLYHPFRDVYAKEYPRGIPFKNFLITDPVRQQYPWRSLSIESLKNRELPLWNPYSLGGTSLLANFQSAVFYPLNILFFLIPFHLAWSILIFLGPIIAGIFTYLYLKNLKLNVWSCILGSLVFSFSGFSIVWLEWGTITHVALWLPLILLAIDKIFEYFQPQEIENGKNKIVNTNIKNKKLLIWSITFIFSLTSSFFAGHLQTFFYLFILSLVYLLVRLFQFGGSKKTLSLFAICYLLFAIVTAIQWIPTFQFLLESSRAFDQNFQKEGWFIPWQNLIQFVAPDFFGNPSTLNYWGVFNYAEFVGYVGILPIIFAFFALFFRRDKKTLFYGTIFFLSLIFALPTIFAKIPYILNIPFVSTAQPTRLLFLTDFSLAVLAALGFDLYLRKGRGIFPILIVLGIVLVSLWGFTIFGKNLFTLSSENLEVARRNLILPETLFVVSVFLLMLLILNIKVLKKKLMTLIIYIIIVITVFDLLRFGLKFTPFTKKEYLFPTTHVLSFLQKDKEQFRIMTTDSRIFPPNFSVIYKIQSLDGYDPLYLTRYAQLIAASERGEPNINPPFGFNRIITPHNFESKIIDLLGVKYILSLKDLESSKLQKVFQEGETRVYKNKNAYPRTFFVEKVIVANNKTESIRKIFEVSLDSTAVVGESLKGDFGLGKVRIIRYTENEIVIQTENQKEGFLVLIENFYPTWRAKIDGRQTRIYKTDYNFRGIVVPKGKHKIEFYNSLF